MIMTIGEALSSFVNILKHKEDVLKKEAEDFILINNLLLKQVIKNLKDAVKIEDTVSCSGNRVVLVNFDEETQLYLLTLTKEEVEVSVKYINNNAIHLHTFGKVKTKEICI